MVSGSPRPSTPPPARPPIPGHSHRSGPRPQAPLFRAWEAWEARGAWGGSGVPATVHPGPEGCPGPPYPTLDLFSAPSPRAETTPRRPQSPAGSARRLPDAHRTLEARPTGQGPGSGTGGASSEPSGLPRQPADPRGARRTSPALRDAARSSPAAAPGRSGSAPLARHAPARPRPRPLPLPRPPPLAAGRSCDSGAAAA